MGICLLVVLLAVAIHNFGRVGDLNASLDIRDRRILELESVLDNQTRLLDHLQRDYASWQERFDRLVADTREQVQKEREVLSILDEALVLMSRSILRGHEAPEELRRRAFGVFKRAVPQLFSHPEDIRNVCVLEPSGGYLRLRSHCTVPLPLEVAGISRYYVGSDDSRRHEAGLEGRVYRQIDGSDSNLEDIELLTVVVSDRLSDRAPGYDDYIGFYGRTGLSAPFASYVVVPISHQWGVLRIESLANDTFGPSQFPLLKQVARKLDLAFSVALALDRRQGKAQND